MKRFYVHTGVKLGMFGLAMLCVMGASYCAFATLNLVNGDCAPGREYENSNAYRNIVFGHVIAAANLYRMEGEDLSALTFVQRQEQEALCESVAEALAPENSNFRYQILSADGTIVLTSNFSEDETFESLGVTPYYATVSEESMRVHFPQNHSYYATADDVHLFYNNGYGDHVYPNSIFSTYGLVNTAVVSTDWENYRSEDIASTSASSYVLRYGVLQDYPATDALLAVLNWYYNMQSLFPFYVFGAIACAALALVLTVLLCLGAGRRAEQKGVALRQFDRIPYEFLLLLLVSAGCIGLTCLEEFIWWGNYIDSVCITAACAYSAYIAALVEAGLMTTAVRIKAHRFWYNTLIGALVRLCSNMLGHLDLCWKFVLLYIGYEFISLLLCSSTGDIGLFFLLSIINFFLLLIACRWAVKFAAVRTGAEELSKGNLEYRINTLHLPPLLKEHANNLNHISDGMSAALEEQMKSERLKSELITNVSHDIKTPLTSIINYVDLIKAEQIDNPKVQEYIAVLDRQSARLKKLTNDLVDASKASSGTMHVELTDVDACELLQQATGEYSERLAANDLTPVFSLPETPIYIRADGALLWRVIDNLLSNICKYALPGTRVYMSAESDGAQLTVSVKNVSRAALNIPPDELMERFVRGDSSRNSEGSGLGLSIARSLTDLMGGTFDLEIDGDLFKARLTFPVIVKPHG